VYSNKGRCEGIGILSPDRVSFESLSRQEMNVSIGGIDSSFESEINIG
jgi:hypothetical protein